MSQERKDRYRRRRRRTLLWTCVLFAFLIVGAAGSAVWMKGRELVAPDWLKQQIATRISAAAPDVQVAFGDVVAMIDDNWRPRLFLRDVTLRTPAGTEIVTFANVTAGVDMDALLERQLRLSSLRVNGMFLALRRTVDGALVLSAGQNTGSVSREASSLVQMLGELDEFLLKPAMAGLRDVDVRAVTLRFEDARAGRAWTLDGGRLRLIRQGLSVQIAAELAILGGSSAAATMAANYAGVIGENAADFGLTLANLDAADIASQSPAFAWLGAVQAPISGAVRGGLNDDGTFNPVNATLQIGAGTIQPTPQARPIPIDGARSYFSYLPAEQTLRFDEFVINSKWGSGQLEGRAVHNAAENGQLEYLVGQIRLTGLSVNPADLYPAPVAIDAAELDFRLGIAPFSLQVGRLQISDDGQVLRGAGDVTVDDKGWNIAFDAGLEAIAHDKLLQLWPERLKPKTRRWVSENVRKATISDAVVALRLEQGARPNLHLGFDFDGADVRFLKHMPPVRDGRGHAALTAGRFSLLIDEGVVTAPEGGVLDVAGTSFIVPDTTAKPDPPGIVRLAVQAPVTAALSMIDQPPLTVMRKADVPVTVATGEIDLDGTIFMPLKKGAKIEEISYTVTGLVSDALSNSLVKDRSLAAAELALFVTEKEVRLKGRGTVDAVPVDVAWQQPVGRGEPLPGQVTGTVEITNDTLTTFNVDLPPGTLNGSASADFTLDLMKGQLPQFRLVSDLKGASLAVAPLGWAKPASSTGRLDLALTLGDVPKVDAFVLEASGLTARGDITLTETRNLQKVQLTELRIGQWLNVQVDLLGRGKGVPPEIVLKGGTIDMRRAEFPDRGTSQNRAGPLTVALDRVQISDTIGMTDVTGAFIFEEGLSGRFEGSLNGQAPVSGRVTPRGGRTAVRIVTNDAGRLLTAASVTTQARGGKMMLELLPVGTGGAFDGRLTVDNMRITKAPTIAALLNSISVVGLINELSGEGIVFSEVKADFRMTPARITLREASAVGASMGLSMDGVFEPDTGSLQMQGVITPVYMINSIGSVLTRRGEGLFGFNYSITGTAQNPNVFVNPLTALAPGMFRNLFRRSEPEVPLEEGEPEREKPRPPPVVTRGEDR